MIATFFFPPTGRREQHEITEVEPYDASFFEQNRIKVSMETLSTGYQAIYADTGKRTEDGEPDEITIVSGNMSCREMLSRLRKLCEERFNAETHDLYKDGDPEAPREILDWNGDIVLGLCKKCGRGESQLNEPCGLNPGEAPSEDD